jgi:hypothetical protein
MSSGTAAVCGQLRLAENLSNKLMSSEQAAVPTGHGNCFGRIGNVEGNLRAALDSFWMNGRSGSQAFG